MLDLWTAKINQPTSTLRDVQKGPSILKIEGNAQQHLDSTAQTVCALALENDIILAALVVGAIDASPKSNVHLADVYKGPSILKIEGNAQQHLDSAAQAVCALALVNDISLAALFVGAIDASPKFYPAQPVTLPHACMQGNTTDYQKRCISTS